MAGTLWIVAGCIWIIGGIIQAYAGSMPMFGMYVAMGALNLAVADIVTGLAQDSSGYDALLAKNEKLREALSIALQYVPPEGGRDEIYCPQEDIDRINELIKEAT